MNLKEKIEASWVYKYRGAILFMICLVLAYLAFKKPKTITIVSDNPVQLKKVDSMRDANGKLYAVVTQQVLEIAQVKAYTDSLAKALKLKPKYIQGVDKIVTKDSVVYKDLPSKPLLQANGDTAYAVSFNDAWTDITAVVGKDTGTILYESRDTLTRVDVVENHLFKPTTHTIYMGNANPHNEVKEGASFSIKEKRAWLSVGPYIGYDPFQKKASIGISAQLPIFQFKK